MKVLQAVSERQGHVHTVRTITQLRDPPFSYSCRSRSTPSATFSSPSSKSPSPAWGSSPFACATISSSSSMAVESPMSSSVLTNSPIDAILWKYHPKRRCRIHSPEQAKVKLGRKGWKVWPGFGSRCTALVLDRLFVHYFVPRSSLFPIGFPSTSTFPRLRLNGQRKVCVCVETVGSRCG